ncbi:hypothetical protein DVH05_026377 [Phytophthora capsici]|nr:hypothetical protein DVH05_026377 [Phytophthora capsici]
MSVNEAQWRSGAVMKGYLLVYGDVSVVSNSIVCVESGTSITGTAGLDSAGGSSDDTGSSGGISVYGGRRQSGPLGSMDSGWRLFSIE